MKPNYKSLLFLFMAFAMTGIFASCSDDENLPNGGNPMISYIRITNPEASDSLIVSAGQGSMIAIIGQNLQDARELWINNRRAAIIPTFITNSTIITRIPSRIPTVITNKMKIIFANGDSLLHDFQLAISKPEIISMVSEYVEAGNIAIIKGDYFYGPVIVTFTGGVTGEVVELEENTIHVVVPEGAEPGPITVTTNFGTTDSRLWFRDNRNIILNYDDLTADGSWRPGPVANIDGIDGNYLRLHGTLDANQRVEDDFESQFWGNTRYPQKRNLFEGSPKDLVLKFEARVVKWYGSYLQICWGPYENAGNQEVWGNLNGRGLWSPWEVNDANFSTDGEWITVAIPLTEMKYRMAQEGGNNVWIDDMEFDRDIAGTLSFWVIATPKADASPVEIHIDNVRIVEK